MYIAYTNTSIGYIQPTGPDIWLKTIGCNQIRPQYSPPQALFLVSLQIDQGIGSDNRQKNFFLQNYTVLHGSQATKNNQGSF